MGRSGIAGKDDAVGFQCFSHSSNGNFKLAVGRLTCGHGLQPQARREHPMYESVTAIVSFKFYQFITDRGNDRD